MSFHDTDKVELFDCDTVTDCDNEFDAEAVDEEDTVKLSSFVDVLDGVPTDHERDRDAANEADGVFVGDIVRLLVASNVKESNVRDGEVEGELDAVNEASVEKL